MAYAILRTEKYKARDKIAGLVGHHLRIPGSKLDNVDLSRSHLNVVIGAHDRDSFNKAVRDRIATCTRKPRPDANKVVEMLLTASPEFFEGKSYDEQRAYLYDCLDFAKGFFGEANIVGAYMHFDEKTPHLSILCVPIETSVRKTKKMEREVTTLNASHYLGGQAAMIQMQTDFALFVQARGHDLLRGEPKAETDREHEPLGSYWKKQAKEIDAAAVAAADHLDDAAIKSRVASDLLASAVDEAQRTGFEAQAMAVQRGALDAERAALEELREAMKGQGAAVDLEWDKLRTKALAYEAREKKLAFDESMLVLSRQALNLSNRVAADLREAANKDLASVRELKTRALAETLALAESRADILRSEQVAQLVNTPELLGMLEFLSVRKDARDLISLVKADPAMALMVRQQIEVATNLSGADLDAVEWNEAFEDVDWVRVTRAAHDAESGGPAGP